MAKVKTVVSMGLHKSNNGVMQLSVEDEHSGDHIMEVSFTLEELALLVTGLHGVKGEATIYTKANIAKERETRRVFCDKVSSYNKEEQRKRVLQDIAEHHAQDGWLLHSDGTTSQQRGSEHEYIIKRYVDVKDTMKVERHY